MIFEDRLLVFFILKTGHVSGNAKTDRIIKQLGSLHMFEFWLFLLKTAYVWRNGKAHKNISEAKSQNLDFSNKTLFIKLLKFGKNEQKYHQNKNKFERK